MQGKVTEERLQGGHHHPHTLFQGITRLQGGGGGEVVLVGEEGDKFLATPSYLLLPVHSSATFSAKMETRRRWWFCYQSRSKQ